MYVFHTPLHLLVGLPLVGDYRHSIPALLYFAAMTAVTFVCAVISWNLLEKHFLALKRYFPS